MREGSGNMPVASFVKLPFSVVRNHSKAWLGLFWAVIFILPLCLWHHTSGVYTYFRYGAPDGQIAYVFSKLLALYGVQLLWYQALSTLLSGAFDTVKGYRLR